MNELGLHCALDLERARSSGPSRRVERVVKRGEVLDPKQHAGLYALAQALPKTTIESKGSRMSEENDDLEDEQECANVFDLDSDADVDVEVNEMYNVVGNDAGESEVCARERQSRAECKSIGTRRQRAGSQKAGVVTRQMRHFMSGWVEKKSPRGTPKGSPTKTCDSVHIHEVEVTDQDHVVGPE